ncbi:MAG: DUF222 domain-containing protein [Acidimicrobiia bacterium]|nr:DUF222 domain-containing protein [Acidimicrobiia bacterium]
MFERLEQRAEVEVVPHGLDQIEPGPVLAAFLSSIDVSQLSGFDRIVVLRARQRLVSHYQAQLYGDMAAVSDAIEDLDGPDDPEAIWDGAAAEIRAALRLTRRTADTELGVALDLRERLPHLYEAFEAGIVDVRRARTILRGTAHLDTHTARRVVTQILERAPQLTTGQLKAALARLCIEVDPADAKTRFEHAIDERRIVAELSEDGAAHLSGFDLPPDRVAAITTHINELATSLRRNGESRSMDQLRADVYLDLLEGHHRRRNNTRGIELRVDLETLARLSEAPGELAGYGPVIADISRQITEQQTAGTQWRFVVTDPHTGMPVTHGITRRRPTATQQRHVIANHQTCVFPGCRMPATNCDLDHRIPWAHSHTTRTTDLAPGCRQDHIRIRHRHGWTYQPLPGGDWLWTSRLGHRYTTSGRSP